MSEATESKSAELTIVDTDLIQMTYKIEIHKPEGVLQCC
jgi:hypothetical protein